ncbi:hypothetical protein MHY49_13930, partial [Brachybacterium sp. ACRRE]|nr:hypothetical protein [Brachybacterium sp. ACRRE]
DHIEEFDHDHPGEGGVTEIENLHVLCWSHHQVKTARDIDPVRLRDDGKSSSGGTDRGNDGSVKHGGSMSSPVDPGIPVSRTLGRTHWSLGDAVELTVEDQGDLMTPLIVRELETAWHQHLAITARAAQLPSEADDGPDVNPGASHAQPQKRSAPFGDPPF